MAHTYYPIYNVLLLESERPINIIETLRTCGSYTTLSRITKHAMINTRAIIPCWNFSNLFLKTTRSVISVHILVLVSMRKYILNHK